MCSVHGSRFPLPLLLHCAQPALVPEKGPREQPNPANRLAPIGRVPASPPAATGPRCVSSSAPRPRPAASAGLTGEVALAAVHAVEVGGHEDAGAALGAHLAQALHLARVVHLVELEHPELDLLVPAGAGAGQGVVSRQVDWEAEGLACKPSGPPCRTRAQLSLGTSISRGEQSLAVKAFQTRCSCGRCCAPGPRRQVSLVLLLLGLGVGLLLALLGTTQQAHEDVHLGVIAHAAGLQALGILQLAAAEHHALLVSGDACGGVGWGGGGRGQVQQQAPRRQTGGFYRGCVIFAARGADVLAADAGGLRRSSDNHSAAAAPAWSAERCLTLAGLDGRLHIGHSGRGREVQHMGAVCKQGRSGERSASQGRSRAGAAAAATSLQGSLSLCSLGIMLPR